MTDNQKRAKEIVDSWPQWKRKVLIYTSDMAGSGQFGICAKCHKGPTIEGHDGCLGTLPGTSIMNACCGHGKDSQAYIQYWGGRRIAGSEAIDEQSKLLEELKGS